MSAFVGMDVDQVAELGKNLAAQAERISHISSRMEDLVRRTSGVWRGSDAEQFGDWWSSQHRPALRAAHDAIEGLAQSAKKNAEEQKRASAGNTGGALATGSVGGLSTAMQDYVRSHPLRLSDDPAEAARQWAALSPALRDAYINLSPQVVGNTDGLPAEDRSRANLSTLHQTRVEFDQRLSGHQADLAAYRDHLRGILSRAYQPGDTFNLEVGGFISTQESERLGRLHAEVAYDQKIVGNADAVSSKLEDAKALDTQAYLLIFRPEDFRGDGRAAIAFGNPDYASNTAIIVPGLNSTVESVYSNNSDADNLYQQMKLTNPGQPSSVISYMGYDAPEMNFSVVTEARAKAGADLLREDVEGWRAAHVSGPNHVTVIGHSYGSTTVADAVDHGMKADDYVLIGSPGMGTASASDFPSGHLYTGSATADPVAQLSRFGQDPAASGSGAVRFHAESPDRGDKPWYLFADHSRYFQANTAGEEWRPSESLANIATIANGGRLGADDIAPLKPLDGVLGAGDLEDWHQPDWGDNERAQ